MTWGLLHQLSFHFYLHQIYFSILSLLVYMCLEVSGGFLNRQHTYGSCFCIHLASLCLLVGSFNPFTFKVIIDIYVPIVIFLIVWGWFYRSFPFLVFLDYVSPFNVCCKAGLVVLNCLSFFLSEKLFISQFWMRSLLDIVILVVDFSLSVL